MRRAAVGAEECREPQLASGGALLPGTVNLWLRWPEAGMLRTASHSASEAAERTVRPWTLQTLLCLLGKARRGLLFYILSLPSFSLSASPPPFLPPLSSPSPSIFFSYVSNFSTLILCIPMLLPGPHHSPQTSSPVLFLLASILSDIQAWYQFQED